MTELLECKNVTKKYKGIIALDNANIKIKRGRIIGLIGKNGAGKTTLIKLINDLLTPDKGTIKVCGEKVGSKSKLRISYLPERTYLDKQMSVEEVIKYFADFYSNFDVEKAHNLLKELRLDSKQKIIKMSKGMQEKVQLVLVMSRRADLYILDEPLGGVDPATRDYILKTILSNFDEDASMIISTHIISDIEKILDDVIILDQGKVVVFDSADKIRKENKKSIDEFFRSKFKF